MSLLTQAFIDRRPASAIFKSNIAKVFNFDLSN